MNIAMIVYSHYSRDARVRRYAESLARKGFSVDVICLKENYKPKEANISLIPYPIPRRRFGKAWYTVEYLLFFLYSFIVLSLNYFTKKYKFIHIHNMPDFLVFSAVIPKLFGAKIILDMHDPMPELYMSKFNASENDLMVKWLKLLERISFNFADQIITANEEFKSIFLKRLNLVRGSTSLEKKISVILNCPDPRIFSLEPNEVGPRTRSDLPRKYFTLLYMGTVEERFGLDIAIEAIPDLVKKIPNLRLIIIPKLEEEGEYLRNLKLETRNLKLEKYIKFLTPLPLEKIAQKIKEADVGIVLAQNGIFTQSIFPVKLLEFIQMNKPVIATKTNVLSRYFNTKMIYFLQKNTSKEFGESVFEIWKNKRLKFDLIKNARSYLLQNNWPKEEKKYLKLISSI